jgi:hypothetical protein
MLSKYSTSFEHLTSLKNIDNDIGVPKKKRSMPCLQVYILEW